MAIVKITNMLKFYTLMLLSGGPKHGYDLIKELEQGLGRKISASNVYPFLDTLSKNNIIRNDKVGKREKKIYHLTPEGKKFVSGMFNRFGGLIETAIEPKLTVCAHCDCKVYEGGHIEKVKGKTYKFCCSHCAATYKRMRD